VSEDGLGQDVVQSWSHVNMVMGLRVPQRDGNIHMTEYLARSSPFSVDCAVFINMLTYRC
jgi:hypothetical protein